MNKLRAVSLHFDSQPRDVEAQRDSWATVRLPARRRRRSFRQVSGLGYATIHPPSLSLRECCCGRSGW